MRVLFLASDPALGPDVPFGDSIRVRLLLEALERLGHELDVRWAGPATTPLRVSPPPERRTPEGLLHVARDVRSLLRATAFAREALRGPMPDVVFEFASYLAPIGLLAARRFRVPYVVEVEGPLADLRYERGGRSLRPLGDAFERRRLRGAAAVVAVSEPLAEFLVGVGATRQRTVVIPNAVDPRRFRPDPTRRAEVRARLGFADRVVVGFHGVFAPWYRLDTLVEAIAGEERIALLLVGDGVERERVEAAIARTGAADQVTITGFVPHDEVAGYVDAFDLAVVAGHTWWTSPLKLFEYGAMRKPVVASRARSITAVARDHEVELVDADELKPALVRLAGDPAARERLSSAWADRVDHEYTTDVLTGRLGELLDRVLR
jgi:glycosyltransferase involved in cell wall biosynthesis